MTNIKIQQAIKKIEPDLCSKPTKASRKEKQYVCIVHSLGTHLLVVIFSTKS